jgi:hypothetical protein
MKRLLLIITISLFFTNIVKSQCPPNAFAFASTYPQCAGGCGVLLKDWPEGVIVNIYGGSPLSIIASVVIPGTYGGPGVGSAFSCVPCGIPLVFASAIPGATNGCVITSLGVVPITISNFTVTTTTNVNKTISWSVANETVGDHYIVQKSADGTNFNNLTTIAGGGGLNKNYTYTDASNIEAVQHYRLKIINKDGAITYSKIVATKAKQNGGFAISPNPTNGSFKLNISANLLPVQVSVFNAQGQQVLLVNSSSANTILNNTLAKGIYAVKVTDKNKNTSTQLLVKQ